ncbi:MAG: hypothetical protein ACO398_08650 [Kiritimatiellia bacterium]
MTLSVLTVCCISCGRGTETAIPVDQITQQAVSMAGLVRDAFPEGAEVLVLVLTDKAGEVPENFLIQQAALEEALAEGSYTFTRAGPDLRRSEEQDILFTAMHEGWPVHFVDQWIRAHDPDVVVSLVPLTDEVLPGGPLVITYEDIAMEP